MLMKEVENQISDILKINHYVLNLFPYWEDELLKEWDKEITNLVLKVSGNIDLNNFYKKLMRLSSLLNDGHTLVYLPEKIKETFTYFPFKLAIIEDNLVIVECEDKYQEYLLKPIKKLNNFSDTEFRDLCITYGWISNREFSINLLQSETSFLIEEDILELEFIDNSKNEFKLIDKKYEGKSTYIKQLPKQAKILHDSEEILIAKINKKILVKINHFMTEEVVTNFYKYAKDYLKAEEIIFDLRNNLGGNSGFADAIYQGFIDEAIEMEKAYRQVIDSESVASATMNLYNIKDDTAKKKYKEFYEVLNHQYLEVIIEKSNFKQYQGLLKLVKVKILQNRMTYSSAENFIINFDNNKRALLIGENTAGSTGQPAWIKLKTGGMFMITAKRVEYPNGKTHHNIGIKPDVFIQEKLEDKINNVDSVLNFALS